MTGAVRVAVIGAAGWAGRRHVEAFSSLGARVVALVDPSPAVHELAARVDAAVPASADELTPSDVDLVVVSLPSSMQPSVTADLLRRGIRVLVEKPLGSSVENARALAGVQEAESALMVGYTLHHHPVARALSAWIASADVISVSVRSAARKLRLDTWRVAPEEGGVTVVNGIHALEYVSSMFPGRATVLSRYESSALHRTAATDYSTTTIGFDEGPLFRLETYWNPWHHTSGLNGNDWSIEVDVVAHEGRRVWSNWALRSWDRGGHESVQHYPEVDLFREQAASALAFARGARPVVGYRQALRATELADEILQRKAVTA